MATAYEAVYIVDATLAEDQVKTTVDKYAAVIARANGSVEDTDIWDPRKLAYEIKGYREGRYIIVNFLGQFVDLAPQQTYRLQMRLRAALPGAGLAVGLCEKWLVASATCEIGRAHV